MKGKNWRDYAELEKAYKLIIKINQQMMSIALRMLSSSPYGRTKSYEASSPILNTEKLTAMD